jgi:hypothetical protein
MKLATFGEIASFVHAESGLRLPIRYTCYLLGDDEVATLAACLVERVGDGGWARQLPSGIQISQLRPLLFTRMAALAVPTVTFAGRGGVMLQEMGAVAQWAGDLPIDAMVTPAAGGAGLEVERPPRIPE